MALLQVAVIGSRTYRAMSSSDRRLLSAFRPCWTELTGGHCHECIPSSRASMSGTLLVKVFHLRMARGVGEELIPTLTSRRKLPTALFWGEKKGSTMAKSSWYGCAGLSFAPTASAVLSSCYLMKTNSLCLGTVLTLLHGRSVANQKSLTSCANFWSVLPIEGLIKIKKILIKINKILHSPPLDLHDTGSRGLLSWPCWCPG